jgi:hypothetical protein
MAVKVPSVKLLLSKCYVFSDSCLCLYARVCIVCPFGYDYINIGLWAVELLKSDYWYCYRYYY